MQRLVERLLLHSAPENLLHASRDECERRAYLVGYVGEEFHLQVGYLLLYRHLLLQLQDGGQYVCSGAHRDYGDDEIQQPCPARLPERGQHLDAYLAHVVHPHSVAVRGAYLQRVSAWRQVVVYGVVAVAYHVPSRIDAIYHIGIAYVGRVAEVERRKLQVESVLVRWQRDAFRAVDVALQYGVIACRRLLLGLVHEESREDNLRHELARLYPFGVEINQGVVARGVCQQSVLQSERHSLVDVNLLAEESRREVLHAVPFWRIPDESVFRGKPQVAGFVLLHGE